MNDSEINYLNDLRQFRSAPIFEKNQKEKILKELISKMNDADWFTIGIMAPSSLQAILVLKEMERFFNWEKMQVTTPPEEDGPVFLKANQKTGDIHIRIEYGLGQGILIGCQFHDEQMSADTFGPLPLNIFSTVNS